MLRNDRIIAALAMVAAVGVFTLAAVIDTRNAQPATVLAAAIPAAPTVEPTPVATAEPTPEPVPTEAPTPAATPPPAVRAATRTPIPTSAPTWAPTVAAPLPTAAPATDIVRAARATTQQIVAAYFPEQPAKAWAVVMCESGGNPAAVNPNGHYGLWQFGLATYAGVGGVGNPANASAEEQTRLARVLYLSRGWQPWSCA